ncbi:MAG: sel1 repeat family protein [Magnetococcales bacterium]|nr:sel1 repeat family protein [Magnetococcales bacterium]
MGIKKLVSYGLRTLAVVVGLLSLILLAAAVLEGQFEDLTGQAYHGDVVAQTKLGLMYEQGSGVPQDFDQAMKWYRKAAKQGYSEAYIRIGSLYHNGTGVVQDFKEAIQWYRKAADQSDATAQFLVGEAYYLGQGVKQDAVQSLMWYTLAAERGHQEAIKMRDRLIDPPWWNDVVLTREQIVKAQELARHWQPARP